MTAREGIAVAALALLVILAQAVELVWRWPS